MTGSRIASCILSALFLVSEAHAESIRERPYPVTEDRAECAEFHPERHPYFGDLHVHTAYSQDASTQGTRNEPRDAYRFARGGQIGLQPYDAAGKAGRSLRLARPLDFAAVTDHAELLGETQICADPQAEGYDSWICWVYRHWPRVAFYLMNFQATGPRERFDFCGPGGQLCVDASLTPWSEIQAAAEGAYDRSAECGFTSFVAYEWTGARDLYNLHRNVIFRNDDVPRLPTSFFEEGTGSGLWRALRRTCVDAGGRCDALVIPHNSNLSGGLMFEGAEDLSAADARERARAEPLVEVMQHKGDSECMLGLGGASDEECGFEKLPYDGFTGKFFPPLAGETAPASFVRGALRLGLTADAQSGVNPLQFGMIASSDTHLGAAGAVEEKGHPGHGGAGTPARESLPPGLKDNVEFNPGGLAVLWAEENTRDSLFGAMRRREAYGTSGPRMLVRFFGGWDLPEDLCASTSRARVAYGEGVPMGGVLPDRPGEGAPRFALWAARDPESAPLRKLQIVKGWTSEDASHETVIDVAEHAGPEATVDPGTCTPQGEGADALCAVWTDPDFSPESHAFYYARVLENPTCRWSAWACLDAGVDCAEPSTMSEGFEPCCAEEHQPTVRERAWTSPIWFSPPSDSGPG